MCSGCHFEPMPSGARRRHPRRTRRTGGTAPTPSSTSRSMPRLREQLAVARDEVALVRARGPRSGSSCTARTRRRGSRARGRSPPSRGIRCVSPSTKRLPRCGSPCTSVRSPSRYSAQDVARALRRRTRRAVGSRRAAGRRRRRRPCCTNFAPPSPRPVAFGAIHARSPPASKRGDSQYRACSAASCSTMSRARNSMSASSWRREAAARRLEVFEHHHVAVVVRVRRRTAASGRARRTSPARSR